MPQPIFITGIGTGVGKTIAAAILVEALEADYWKPIQAGFADGTDTLMIKNLISNSISAIHTEIYKFSLPASPHIAARNENKKIDLDLISEKCRQLATGSRQFIIEGAGGLLVPLNEKEFVVDLIKKLNVKVILVSRNYLGSINHSLLTAAVCKQNNIEVVGWIFNDEFMSYEDEIAQWTGISKICSITLAKTVDKVFIKTEAKRIKEILRKLL